MGVIKAKNSNGEWVNVAEATTITNELVGDLQVVYEGYGYGNRKNYIDLSKYVGVGNDFIIFPSVALHYTQYLVYPECLKHILNPTPSLL